jgi:hypothetical protein
MTPLTWTTEKPTAPGWYWWRFRGHSTIIHLNDSLLWQLPSETGFVQYLRELSGQFAGPIQKPKE